MGNFDFVRAALPALHEDCARAESYLTTDPRTACFYARRAVEAVVSHVYRVGNLREPFRADLAARINDDDFIRVTGESVRIKLDLVRHAANTAVHASRQIQPSVGLTVLRELFHVMVWVTFHHSPHPELAPTRGQFDPALAKKSAPLSRTELVQLAEQFRAQDEEHARVLAERDETLAHHEAEIARLRVQIAAAQATRSPVDDHDYSEADTRDLFIDLLLGEAGWTLTEPRDREYPVTGMPNGNGTGFVDYVLWGADGLPLAVVEAKRTTTSPAIGQQQAKVYADRLEAMTGRRPVIYYTNGYEHWLWDDGAGYPPREVQGFATRDELELMVARRRARKALVTAPVDTDIAGRPYQLRAIAAVGETFTAHRRRALLAMATGSGKTRTVIALVDHLMKAGWVKRVLFLADRVALVNQAVGAFKTHLPDVTTVNLVTERNADGRVYVSTYPTMIGLIDEMDDAGVRRFGPGFFDLVIVDEAHRSVYAKYGTLFDWFDSLLVGLTATPKNEVDHNTYRLFRLEDGVPTDSYGLDEAVRDEYLVPPRGVAGTTAFLSRGIAYDDLPADEQDEWEILDWGEDGPPDSVEAAELNQFLFNADTVDKVLGNLMTEGYKVAGGDRLGKTIIFARNQRHAEFIQQRFDAQWPEHAGTFARTVTHAVSYAQSLIDDFSEPAKAPHIAISVDMLDTGIDVPEVVNLVFFKPVRSKTKFWQMIGRGTRLRPDLFGPGQDKRDFLVFDYCGNLAYFGQDLPGTEGSTQRSLTQLLVETRIDLIRALDSTRADGGLRRATADSLHAWVRGMTLDNILVRPHRRAVEEFSDRGAWDDLTVAGADVARTLAGLPSSVGDTDEDAKRFDLLILRRQLAQLDGDTRGAEKLQVTVQEIAAQLATKIAIPMIATQSALLEDVAGDEWWIDVTVAMLEGARLRLRGLVRFLDRSRRNPVYTDFVDTLGEMIPVDLQPRSPGTDVERFLEKATAYLREHEDHLALQRLRRNRQLTPEDLTALEDMLLAAGGERTAVMDLAHARGGLGLFIRSLVGLNRSAVQEAFATYLDESRFTYPQIRFINLVIDDLTANGAMEPGRLFESPYTDHAPTGPDQVFLAADVTQIVAILEDIKHSAVPTGAA